MMARLALFLLLSKLPAGISSSSTSVLVLLLVQPATVAVSDTDGEQKAGTVQVNSQTQTRPPFPPPRLRPPALLLPLVQQLPTDLTQIRDVDMSHGFALTICIKATLSLKGNSSLFE